MPKDSVVDFEFIFKEAIDMTPDCFGIFNEQAVVVYGNHVFVDIFGGTREKVIGQGNRELLRRMWVSKQGVIINTDNFDQWYEVLESVHNEKKLNSFEMDLVDGRWFKMTRVTLENGYVLLFGVNITELKETQKSLEEANQQIEVLANTDQLTQINNRRAFYIIAEQEIKKSKRYQQALSLLLIDIDYFKQINDDYGHESGDDVLREFANMCQTLLRESDPLCRVGGEEFVVILPMTTKEGAYKLAKKVCARIAEYDFYLPQQDCFINISVSIGVSCLSNTNKSIKSILSKADVALYSAKKNGRNQVIL